MSTFFQFSSGNGDILVTAFKYDSFQRFNLNIETSFESDDFDVTVLFVIKHAPLFWSQKRNVKTQRIERDRYCGDEKNFVWKDLINSCAFTITYTIEKQKFYSWMKKLQDRLPCSVTYNEIICENYMGPSEKSLNVISRLPPNAKYFLECLYSRGFVGHFLMDYYLFKKDDIKLLQEFRRKNQWNLVNEYFRTMFIFLKKDISLASLNFNPNDFPEKQNLDGHVSIKNIIITPTKILKEDEEETSNNRAFRRLGTENILQIKFREEDGSWFPRDQNLLKTKMHDRLINGLTISGRIYHAVGCSLQ